MKTNILLIIIALLTLSTVGFGQASKKSTEVLYFKANLACCRARACDALQKDVENAVQSYSTKQQIEFKVIKLADPTNKELIDKYSAKSQTVVLVKTKGKKESFLDVSDIVKSYSRTKDKEKFENEMNAKFDEIF